MSKKTRETFDGTTTSFARFFSPAIQLKVCPTQNLFRTIRGVALIFQTVQNANTAGSFN